MRYFSLLIFVLSIILGSCNGSKKSSNGENIEEKVTSTEEKIIGPKSIGIKKSQCFGRCPVFEFTVDQSGAMTYNGKMNVEKMGVWKGQMSKTSLFNLWKYFEAQDTKDLKSLYNSGAMDTPKSTLMIERKDSTQKIIGDFALPEQVKGIIGYMDSLSRTLDFTIFEAHVPRDIIPGELIIDLASDASVDALCKKFSAYNLTNKKRISPAMSLYVLNFDDSKINAGRMLVMIKESPMVKEAQFNKTADQRDK